MNLYANFAKIFETSETPQSFFAPGRINLIGEHTDYNGGNVFPAAISLGTHALAIKREDREIRMYSQNFQDTGMIRFDLDSLAYDKSHDWANYPKGVIAYFLKNGYDIDCGLDILYEGNIPNGAGLSSSASIELVTGVLLEKLFGLTIDRIAMVKIGQKVENEFIGVNSGIMDQFAIGMGKKDHAILLNCDTLAYQYAPIKLDNHKIMIMNTNKQRTLADSKYNERRSECEQAVCDLQSKLDIQQLGELSVEMFAEQKHVIKDPIHRKRAQHVVEENARTKTAYAKLNEGDLQAFGQLMNASHCSLRDNYEVTGLELDTIVEAAWQQPGVLGARMTGAGFGGCAIAIVENEQMETFQQEVSRIYKHKIGYEPAFYTATIAEGAE
ncbi:galactokinase [Virgibacillus sp. 179-BFC.A HS]|uniref:Galactokinase n=1 Tax=Tigheibacillus jepli TaxID=3035914 RepID=A0ABU5CF18_9BACI|nr:galactokinase [Virgibacillus sp. 179-BFC.A HS]MDY0404810.1 galactokinase [Virgibacillus sp. 179-BFC.A HS]